MRALAIILTHNREQLLKRCILAVQKNLNKNDDLFVVVNGSMDGTLAYLKKNKIKHTFQNNSGSAGGWKTGIKMFLKSDKDCAWIMDDDGYPGEKSLSKLKKE